MTRSKSPTRFLVTLLVFIGVALLGAGAANASTDPATPQSPPAISPRVDIYAVVGTMASAVDKGAAFAKLTSEEREAFISAGTPGSVQTTVTVPAGQAPLPADVAQSLAATGTASPDALAASRGCWNVDTNQDYLGVVPPHFKLYSLSMTLGWCGNGKKITSYRLVQKSYDTSYPGWHFEKWLPDGKNNVGWEIRYYIQGQFGFGWPYDLQQSSPCLQTRGGASGLYSQRNGCGLS